MLADENDVLVGAMIIRGAAKQRHVLGRPVEGCPVRRIAERGLNVVVALSGKATDGQ